MSASTPKANDRAALNDFYSTASGETFRSLVIAAGAVFSTYKIMSPAASAKLQDLTLAAGPIIVAIIWGIRQVYQQTKLKIAAHNAEPGTSADEIKRRADAITWKEILLGVVDEGLDVVTAVKRLEKESALTDSRLAAIGETVGELAGRVEALEAGGVSAAAGGDVKALTRAVVDMIGEDMVHGGRNATVLRRALGVAEHG